jgi:hypothetical protein
MDWFERLTGFREQGYHETTAKLAVRGGKLCSSVNGRCYQAGTLEMPSLRELREASLQVPRDGGLKVSIVTGDVRQLHGRPENAGALFQVASQFNLLEMVGPTVTPEDGVTIYEDDGTQGPACAIAAGAATIYRNYFAPVGDRVGQTADCQLNALADFGEALSKALGTPSGSLWQMKNGYALPSEASLRQINSWLKGTSEQQIDALREKLRIGLHWDVEVTDAARWPGPLVSQAFCSAMPVSHTRPGLALWEPIASLVLEASYEATFHAAVLNSSRGGSKRVFLTRLGGGAFGNSDAWIDEAIRRALHLFATAELEVAVVSFGSPSASVQELVAAFAG